MATVRVSPAISSITFTTSGVVAVAAGLSGAITAAEVSAVQGFTPGEWHAPRLEKTDPVTGNASFLMPSVITSITINGNVYAVAAGKITNVLPADATALATIPWKLVTG